MKNIDMRHYNWQLGVLDGQERAEVLDAVSYMRGFPETIQELSAGLTKRNNSRTIFRLPINIASGNSPDRVMVSTARDVVEAVEAYGIASMPMPFAIQNNGEPQNARFELPDGIKAAYSDNEAVGYLRTAILGREIETTLGVLNPVDATYYTYTLPGQQ